MKKKILKDYVKKNNKDFSSGLTGHSSHNRNGVNMIPGYLSQLEDISKKGDMLGDNKSGLLKDDQQYTSDSLSAKKKSAKKSTSKSQFSAIYDPNNVNLWGSHQPLSQKSINNTEILGMKERPGSNKRQTPSKKQHSKSSGKR
jgi:hypothetical protein